jgi:hypothetical protein
MKKLLPFFLIAVFALQANKLEAQTCTGVDSVLYPYYKELVFSSPSDSFFIDAMIGTVRTAAQAYHLSDTISVLGVQFWGGAYSTTGFPQTLQVVAYLYSVDTNNMPVAVIDSTLITVTEQLDFYEGLFTVPDTISGNFAVGVRSFVNDTLAVITNNSGASWQPVDYSEGLAWRRFGSGVWNSSLSFFGQDLEYMIFPIVSYSITPSFTASEDTVCSGTIVTFTNTTTGLTQDRMFNTNTFAEYWGFSLVDSTYSWDFGSGLSYSTNSSYMFTDSGTHTVTMTANMMGYYYACSDTATMDIYVHPAYAINQTAAICEGDSILIGGNYQTASGTYFDSLQTINGCDSVIVTDLTVNPNYMINQNEAICEGDSILLGGNYQTTAGTYYDSLQAITGCDSIVATTLTVNPTYMINQDAFICEGDSILIGGSYQSTSGTYYDSLQTMDGCDSILVVDLTVDPLPTVTLALAVDTVCENDASFTLTGGSPAGGVYSGPGVSGGNFDPVAAGAGTHTIIYMYVDTNGCANSDSADIFVDDCLGIPSLAVNGISIYPNPSNGNFIINLKDEVTNAQVLLINSVGEKVYSLSFSGNKTDVSCNVAAGIYSLQIVTEKGSFINTLFIE